MADDIRIKDLQSTASYMESDDYLPIDSLALGNRKIPFTGLMDSEDDRLPTTDKTPRGAITEHEEDISEIKQSLSDYPTDVNVPMASGGGTYINAEYTHRVFKYLNLKILELSFDFKPVTAGGSYKEIYNIPSGYRPIADKSAFFITAQNKYVQIRLGTDGTVKFYSNNALQKGELVAVYYIYL